MNTRRVTGRGIAVTMVVAASLWMNLGIAGADSVTQSGSVSVVVPGTPEDMQFVLTVNGEDYDNSTVDNIVGGTLTLSWLASQDEPTIGSAGCPGKGAGISIEGVTPSAAIWATWVSPTGALLAGPVQIPSRNASVAVSMCEKDTGNGHGNGGGNGNGNGGGNGNGNGNGNGGGNGNGNGNGGGNGNGNGHEDPLGG